MLVKKVSFYKIPSRKIIQSMKLNNFSLITPKLMHLDTCPLSRLRFLDSYNNLPIDIMKGSVPTRLRRYANFHVKKEDNDYNIYYTGKLDFIQDESADHDNYTKSHKVNGTIDSMIDLNTQL